MPNNRYRPLADELRPTELDEVVGQGHILGPDGLLRRIIESGQIPNMIFYGPSGTGKTTVARIIAEKTNRALRKLNATTAGLADIRAVIDEVGTIMAPNGAGFLTGLAHDKSIPDCLKMGALAAAEIISHYGARPETSR